MAIPETLGREIRAEWGEAFSYGMPDPRHGVPHEVEVWSDDRGAERGARAVTGFVLRYRPGTRPFAIVNGRVRPLAALGQRVDLRETCGVFVDRRPIPPDSRVRIPLSAWARCPPDEAALVLSASDPALANTLSRLTRGGRLLGRPRIGRAWLGGILAEAIAAHLDGRDRESRELAAVAERGFARALDDEEARALGRELSPMRLGWEHASALLREQQRRASLPRPPLAETQPVEALPPAELVARLDDVGLGLSSRDTFEADAIFDALVAAGDAAVPHLIDALERDERWTRAPVHTHHLATWSEVHRVHEVARVVLSRIVGLSLARSTRTEEAAARRAFWRRVQRRTMAQRQVEILREDTADDEARLGAARWLVSAREQLATREVSTREVTVLLTRRTGSSTTTLTGCGFVQALARWDPRGASRGAVDFARRCAADRSCPCLARVAAIAGAHAPDVVRAHAGALRRSLSTGHPPREVDAVEAIALHHDQPAARQFLEWLAAGGPGSPWEYDAEWARRTLVLVIAAMATAPDTARRRAIEARLGEVLGRRAAGERATDHVAADAERGR